MDLPPRWLVMTRNFSIYLQAYDLQKNPQTIGGFYGGAKRDRTADLYNAIVALSQLSYGPFFIRQVSKYLLQRPNHLLTLLHHLKLLHYPKYLRH